MKTTKDTAGRITQDSILVTPQELNDDVEEAKSVIDDISKKCELYMAHIARCTNQVHVINEKEKQLETEYR